MVGGLWNSIRGGAVVCSRPACLLKNPSRTSCGTESVVSQASRIFFMEIWLACETTESGPQTCRLNDFSISWPTVNIMSAQFLSFQPTQSGSLQVLLMRRRGLSIESFVWRRYTRNACQFVDDEALLPDINKPLVLNRDLLSSNSL